MIWALAFGSFIPSASRAAIITFFPASKPGGVGFLSVVVFFSGVTIGAGAFTASFCATGAAAAGADGATGSGDTEVFFDDNADTCAVNVAICSSNLLLSFWSVFNSDSNWDLINCKVWILFLASFNAFSRSPPLFDLSVETSFVSGNNFSFGPKKSKIIVNLSDTNLIAASLKSKNALVKSSHNSGIHLNSLSISSLPNKPNDRKSNIPARPALSDSNKSPDSWYSLNAS